MRIMSQPRERAISRGARLRYASDHRREHADKGPIQPFLRPAAPPNLHAVARIGASLPAAAVWPDPGRGKGKRGGARVHYLWLPGVAIVYLLYVYTKDESITLGPREKRQLRVVVEAIKSEWVISEGEDDG